MKRQVQFDQPALEATLSDYMHEVDHAGQRIQRLEKAIDEAVSTAPESIRAVIAFNFISDLPDLHSWLNPSRTLIDRPYFQLPQPAVKAPMTSAVSPEA
jgi:hypothetical protein